MPGRFQLHEVFYFLIGFTQFLEFDKVDRRFHKVMLKGFGLDVRVGF